MLDLPGNGREVAVALVVGEWFLGVGETTVVGRFFLVGFEEGAGVELLVGQVDAEDLGVGLVFEFEHQRLFHRVV